MTGFLIYDWIEQPKKQEIIQEVLKLLEQKVLEPHSGEWLCAAAFFTFCIVWLIASPSACNKVKKAAERFVHS